MGRIGKRQRIDTGIFRDASGYSVIAYGKEVRMPLDSSHAALLRRRAELIEELGDADPSLNAAPGTLRKDVPRYLKLRTIPRGQDSSIRGHLGAWLRTPLADKPRRQITAHDVLTWRTKWAHKVKPKTINNRVDALRSLFKLLDGRDSPIFAEIKPLPVHRTPPVAVPPSLILEVDRKLQAYEASGRLRDAKTRARFRVRATTGRRPSEIMRAEPQDVDLERRVWIPRDGKGGFTPGIYLIDEAVDAWKLFIEADAWGWFDTKSQARVLRRCGWREDVRPYNLRHSFGIALSEAGIDLADIQQMMGHKDQRTTRRNYVPVLATRLQHAAQKLEGRLTWGTVPRDGSMRDVEPREKAKKSGNQRERVRSGKKGRN